MDNKSPLAVCLDFNGVIVDHRNKKTITGMRELVRDMNEGGVLLAIVSGNTLKKVEKRLDREIRNLFLRILSSSKRKGGKLECIREFASEFGLALGEIAFIDDKPANLKQLACSPVRVIGFSGSGKYDTAGACRDLSLPVAGNVKELRCFFRRWQLVDY